jgi:hypothetical protein
LRFDWWERGQDFEHDMWGGGLSLAMIREIIEHLPRQSALGRKLDPDQWGPAEYLAAGNFDAANIANWQRGNAGKKTPSKPPERLTRPGEAKAKQAKTDQILARARAYRASQQRTKNRG